MAAHDSPSVRERHLARELRLLRATTQMQGKEVAGRLGWSASKVSRIENCRIGIAPDDLELLLDLYAAPPRKAVFLRNLAASVRATGWWDAYRESLNLGYGSLLGLEAGSSTLHTYCILVPHALLMTSEFARRVISLAPQPPSISEVERRLDVARRRQEVLGPQRGREPLRLSMIIDESFLHRRIVSTDSAGDRAIMRDQLKRLLVAAEESNITVQLFPLEAGLPSVTAGSFSILGSIAADAPDVVYLENKSRIFFIDKENEVDSYMQDFNLLASWSLSPADSSEVIRNRVRQLGD
jgi:transcriptional regulator with XRE-family HTH domain